MTEQPETLSDFQQGMLEGLHAAERIARTDMRIDLAKDCGYEPGWQKGRWMVADDIAALIAKLPVNGEAEGSK